MEPNCKEKNSRKEHKEQETFQEREEDHTFGFQRQKVRMDLHKQMLMFMKPASAVGQESGYSQMTS